MCKVCQINKFDWVSWQTTRIFMRLWMMFDYPNTKSWLPFYSFALCSRISSHHEWQKRPKGNVLSKVVKSDEEIFKKMMTPHPVFNFLSIPSAPWCLHQHVRVKLDSYSTSQLRAKLRWEKYFAASRDWIDSYSIKKYFAFMMKSCRSILSERCCQIPNCSQNLVNCCNTIAIQYFE